MESWIEGRGGSVYMRIHVQPRASKNEVAGIHGDSLKLRLTSPPVEGAANALLLKFVSKMLGVSKSAIRIISGEKSRQKTLKVEGLSSPEVMQLLGLAA